MKLLYVRNFAKEINLNNYNSQELGLTGAFLKLNYECEIVLYTKDKEKNGKTEKMDNGILIRYYHSYRIFSNPLFFQVLKLIRKNDYEVIITTEYHQAMTFLLALFKKKELILFHGPYKDENKLIRFYKRPFTNLLNKRIDKVTVKSELSKEYLEEKGFSKVKVVGVGLDTKKIQLDEIQPKKDGQCLNLLYIGSIIKRKNVLFIIDLLEHFLMKGTEVKLTVIGSGEGEYYDEFMNRIDKLPSQAIEHIKSISQDKISRYYVESDFFLLPSDYEIFGMVLLESMFLKTPCVTSINGGSVTLIENGVDGIITDENNVELWFEEIMKIFSDRQRYLSMGEKAHIKIEKDYMWENVVDRINKR